MVNDKGRSFLDVLVALLIVRSQVVGIVKVDDFLGGPQS